eukprot:TRINITY_DN8551_c0_g1_i1.p3 TRINITY_DN8551_c0_g1~~TRINITY_DN8551_c0_g1_i1.p3  ORF type:complete len:160 (+),score=16.01 TRINITY_DN8551_c0_g1_i1:73-552(+)
MLRIMSRVGGAALSAWRHPNHVLPLAPRAAWQAFPPGAVGSAMAQQERSMASKKHKAVLRQTKGYRGRAKNCFTVAVRRLQKALQYSYRDRKQKKRDMRTLWIQRVGAASRQHGMSYNQLIPSLNKARVELNRKVLADIAATEPYSFRAVMDTVRSVKQ